MPFKPFPPSASWRVFLSLALLALALAACAPAATPAVQAPTLPATQAAPTDQAAPAGPVTPAGQAGPTAQALATVAPTQPPLDNEFHPTDPAQVNLAAGRPQFVEFFAFW